MKQMVPVPSHDLSADREPVRVRELVVGATHSMRRLDFAAAEAALGEALDLAPESFAVLAVLGELTLRTGRSLEARDWLNRALLQKPPSWEAYQGLNRLVREADLQARNAFTRRSGAPPPTVLLQAGRWVARRLTGLAQVCPRLTAGKLAPRRAGQPVKVARVGVDAQ